MTIGTVDAVATFCDATRANDVDRIVSTLSPDAELVSPLSGRMVFRGRDDLRVLLGAVYGGLSGLTWREVIGDGATRVAVSDGRIAASDVRLQRKQPRYRLEDVQLSHLPGRRQDDSRALGIGRKYRSIKTIARFICEANYMCFVRCGYHA